MGVTWNRRLMAAFVFCCLVGPSRAEEPQPPMPETTEATPKKPPPLSSSQPESSDPKPSTVDTPALRAQVQKRLKALGKLDEKSALANTKALTKLLEERSGRFDDWDQAVKDRKAAENPSPNPQKQAASWKADLERLQNLLDKSTKDPDLLLATLLHNPGSAPRGSEAAQAELKEAIDIARADLKDWSSKLEQLNADPLRKDEARLGPIRASRDKIFKRLTILKARNPEKESGLMEARSPEARELARETIENFDWEARVETERLKAEEAKLALETKRAENTPLYQQLLEAHVRLAQTTLDRLKARYQGITASREHELRVKAQNEESLAKRSNDPLERYRAKRNAELLDEQSRVVMSANLLATDPSPSLEEERTLADRALADFTGVKHLLDDGRVSHLDALRLTNDFRRIGVERGRIVANELATIESRLTTAENALSSVELELMYDRRDDRYELDALLERLPKPRHAEAMALYEELEKKHFELLNKRRDILDKLASRSQQTLDQILRRLQVLDDHFGFVRTHIFWVRDEDPVGSATLSQARRELSQLVRSAIRMASDLVDKASWGRISAEFLGASFGLVVLPWPLHQARRALRNTARRSLS